MTAQELVDLFAVPVASPTLILNHNLHSAYLYKSEDWFREFYEDAHVIVIDGWPILRLTEGRPSIDARIGSTDWLTTLWGRAQAGLPLQGSRRVFLLGGDAETNSSARARFEAEAPGTTVGGRSGYFDLARESANVIEEIRAFKPDLVLVGMGMPRQERFLKASRALLPAAYYATVGGAIDYVAGASPLAPRILGRIGVEWVWRFINDPRRLFARYFIEPVLLVQLILRSKCHKRNTEA